MSMCVEMGLGCSFQLKYHVLVETPCLLLADLTESTATLNSPCNFTSYVYKLICSPYFLLVLCTFVVLMISNSVSRVRLWFSLLQFLVIVTSFHTVRPFLQFCLFIYLISSVFVVSCLESFGVSMMYFQNKLLSQVHVTGNFSRESVIH